MSKGNITITGKYNDVDLTQFNEDQLHVIITLIRQIERQQKELDYFDKVKKVYHAHSKLRHKMLGVFNFQQNNWNDKTANKAKEILNEAKAIRKELGMKPLKLPKLKAMPKPVQSE